AGGQLRRVRPLAGWAMAVSSAAGALLLETLEEGLPLGPDRGRIGLIAGVEVLDVASIAAIEERGAGKGGIGILTGHAGDPGEGLGLQRRFACRIRRA